MIKIKHNLDSSKYKWLWAKYVAEGNDEKHCTNCLRGKYSKKFSKHNQNFNNQENIEFDEEKENTYKAIYICGVINKGYAQKKNYPHNLHLAIVPKEGHNEVFTFEDVRIEITNGMISYIPLIEELPQKYQSLPECYTTCRIYRWAIGFFYNSEQ